MVACGGGGGTTPSGGGSISGKVIDGYIQGATVCLDLNQNNSCDTGEPSTTTSANGSYTLSYGSDAVIENIPVVGNVPVGAIDQSDGTISKAYTFAAPANNALVISPFSTLALYKIVLKINPLIGAATVLANGFTAPGGLALDASGNLYVTDQNKIFKVTPSGEKTTYAGSSTAGSNDGSLSVARFNSPTGLSISTDGTMYVADTNNDAIRRINMSTGTVSTLDLSTFNSAAYTATNTPKFVAVTSTGLYYAGSNGIFRWDGTRVTG